MKILCTGDLHIGRRSSKIPPDLDGHRHSAATVWERIVDIAIEQQVALIAISGDIVDRANRYFEAYGPLEQGLQQLSEADIDTCLVAGNHDFDVLPRLVQSAGTDRVHLLGRGGRWERFTLKRDGRAVLHVDGWSFPSEHVETNPLVTYQPQVGDGVPILGLLHADVDQASSKYAPVSLADLQGQPVAVWLLGHVHAPAAYHEEDCPLVLYPGTPQALDAGEDGVHGVWLLDIASEGDLNPRQIAASSVRYTPVYIDVTDVTEPPELEQRVAEAVRAALDEAGQARDPGPLECLCCRLVLTGRTRLHRRIRALLQDVVADLVLSSGQVTAVIDKVAYDTRPVVDLEEVARGNDPPGELARVLLALEAAEVPPAYRDLVTLTRNRLHDLHRSAAYVDLAGDPLPDDHEVQSQLLTQGWSLLDALLAQKEQA